MLHPISEITRLADDLNDDPAVFETMDPKKRAYIAGRVSDGREVIMRVVEHLDRIEAAITEADASKAAHG
jgi:hypothetical protein